MNRINLFERKSMSVKTFKRLLMMMAAIMMAFATFTSCNEDEDPSDDPDEIENGDNGNNGGVSGKRLITMVQTTGPIDGPARSEMSYNSDGTVKRVDQYDVSSKLILYTTYTCNSDGTKHKEELYDVSNSSNPQLFYEYTYSYDANKKPLKAEGTYFLNGINMTVTIDYTFQNGRKTHEVLTSLSSVSQEIVTIEYDITYDNNGRRSTTTETHSSLGTRKYTRTYNSDGTLQKVTYPYGYNGSDNRTVTNEFKWENGKKTWNEDDFYWW